PPRPRAGRPAASTPPRAARPAAPALAVSAPRPPLGSPPASSTLSWPPLERPLTPMGPAYILNRFRAESFQKRSCSSSQPAGGGRRRHEPVPGRAAGPRSEERRVGEGRRWRVVAGDAEV